MMEVGVTSCNGIIKDGKAGLVWEDSLTGWADDGG